MRARTSQSGFSIIELIIALAILGVLVFVGYIVYDRQNDKTADNRDTTSQSATKSDLPTAPEVTSTSDLDKAATVLDQTDTSMDDDSEELDAQLQSF